MRCQLLSFSCALVGGILVSSVSGSCYYPNGTFPSDYSYTPCSSDLLTSCCIASEGDQCLSNGLCYSPDDGYMFRGACTDSKWESKNCFQHCKNSTGSYSRSYEQIVSCGGDRYCCHSDDNTCCNDDSKVFQLGSLSVIKDLAPATRTAAGFPTATGTGAVNANPAGSLTSTATPTSTSSDPSSDPTPNSSATSHTTVVVVSVVCLVVFVIVIALFWFFIRRHYRRRLAQGSSQEQAFPMSDDGFQKLPDKSSLAVEAPAPIHTPAPPYQPPAYQNPLQQHPPASTHGAVEMDGSTPPQHNPWGQAVYEVPAQPYRHV